VCNKILQYESAPYTDDTSWFGHASLQVGSSACYMSMKQLSRGIGAELVERRGYNDIDTNFCTDASQVPAWINSGITFYNYRGYIGMDGLSTSTLLALAQGPRTPVATIFTCSTGDFNSGDDFTEAFLNAGSAATPGGAVACMGFATSSTHTRYNNVVVGGYYSGLLEHDLPSVGACLLQGKYELYATLPPSEQGSAANFAYWGNLMGDPGTDQWAGVPAAMAVNAPASLPLGTNFLTLTVTSGGQPVEGAAVCLWQDLATDVQVSGLTNASGQVTLNFSGLQVGTVYVTTTEHRHVPVLQSLTVGAATAAPTVASVGAGIGLLPGGGAQAVSLTLQNQGSAAMTGITLTPSLAAIYGTINNPTLTLASLAAGASYTFNGLSISPVGSLGDDAVLPLNLSVASAQGTFPLQALVPMAAPEMTPGTVTGTLSPGQTANITLGVSNTGAVSGTAITFTVASTMTDVVTVNSGIIIVGNIAAGANGSAVVNLTAAGGANRGQPVPLTVNWTSQGGSISGSFTTILTLGGGGVATSPTGPDAYGYWAYENGDASGYAPTYSWYAISTPEGGPGTEVTLNDNGNEQDDGEWVTLPFAFNYYGQIYTRAMVCSNGFISFDENGFGEFDFRNHTFPSGMGPDAMIAPMWDDHLTTGTTSGVWKYFDSGAHAFVISWYNLSANSSGGPNSFQLVLYDPAWYPTSTGDGPFKFQYLTFNDTQSAGADFPYCSIGFKDHNSLVGLTMRHWTQQPTTTSTVAAGRAIYFSTLAGAFLDTVPPTVFLQSPDTVFAGQTQTVRAFVSDASGLSSVTLNWRMQGTEWNSVAMTSDSTWWQVVVPGQVGGTVVEYTVTAVDASENANSITSSQATYTVSSASLVFSEGFNGTSTFTHTGGGGLFDEWHLETARVYEGSHSCKFGGTGLDNYSSNAGGILTSPLISLAPGATQMSASFRSWILAETSGAYPDSCYDGGKVEWSLDGGAWTDAAISPDYTHSLRWGTSGSTAALRAWLGFPRRLLSGSADWTQRTLAIPDGTTSVQLRWLFGTDTGTQREGFYLDDVRITAVLPAIQPDPVEDLDVAIVTGNTVLSWTAMPNAVAYRIYASTLPYDANPALLAQVSGTTWQEAVTGIQRYYTVRVVY
jgi:hypothetical protein